MLERTMSGRTERVIWSRPSAKDPKKNGVTVLEAVENGKRFWVFRVLSLPQFTVGWEAGQDLARAMLQENLPQETVESLVGTQPAPVVEDE